MERVPEGMRVVDGAGAEVPDCSMFSPDSGLVARDPGPGSTDPVSAQYYRRGLRRFGERRPAPLTLVSIN